MLDPNNASFENKLLTKIKEEKISPKPRWRFLLKNSAVWLAGAVSLLIGAAAVSVIIYLLRFNDWNIYEQTKKSFLEFLVLTLPYFWLVFLGLFIFIIFYNFKHTKTGYRYSAILLVGGSICLSIILGGVFYSVGVGEKLDSLFGRQMPFYGWINPHVDFWSHPDEGRLSGLVIEAGSDSNFVLVDRSRRQWQVYAGEAETYPGAVIAVGQPIRLLGEKLGDDSFRVIKMLPISSGHDFYRRFDDRPPLPREAPLPGAPAPFRPDIRPGF